MKLYTETYAPKSRAELIGDEKAFSTIYAYLSNKILPRGKKAIWLTGPPGTGKSIAVQVMAQELNREFVEINASDTRNSASIEAVLGNAIRQSSLFFSGKVILVDEIDGLSGTKDRGGVSSVTEIINSSPYPIVLTSANSDEQKLSGLKKVCQVIELKPHTPSAILQLLRKIASSEGIPHSEDAMSMLSRKSAGDMRAALNDMQTLAFSAKSSSSGFTVADVEMLGDRRRVETMQQALLKIFKSTDPSVVSQTFDAVEEDIEELFLWLEENIPREYKEIADLDNAFEALSLADVFFGRIRRWQHYRFYVYCYQLLSIGVALAKKKRYPAMNEYQKTSRILKMWIAGQQHAKAKSISRKLALPLHVSSKKMRRDVLPFIRIMSRQKGFAESISAQFRLEEEEKEWLSAM